MTKESGHQIRGREKKVLPPDEMRDCQLCQNRKVSECMFVCIIGRPQNVPKQGCICILTLSDSDTFRSGHFLTYTYFLPIEKNVEESKV